MINYAILLCYFVLIGRNFSSVLAVDTKKFRTCNDTGFCRRNRTSKPPVRELLRDTIVINESGIINGKLAIVDGNPNNLLSLSLTLYASGVARIRIVESESADQNPRWEAEDVLMDAVPIRGQFAEIGMPGRPENAGHSDIVVLYGENDTYALLISCTPLQFTLYINGQESVIVNGKNLMHFEQQGAQSQFYENGTFDNALEQESEPSQYEEKEVIDYGEDGKAIYSDGTQETDEEHRSRKAAVLQIADLKKLHSYTETFDGHIDPNLKGPMSVGVDITFSQSNQLYGIPEHATSLALKDTIGDNSAYSEPYRLYTLDVFEYNLDVPMALYGAIPLLLSHSEKLTCGAFWWNPTETFVDISTVNNEFVPGSSNKMGHFISESGIIDIMLLPGPTPADVLKQYTQFTGRPAMPAFFSLGFHQCRWNYKDEKDVLSVDAGFEREDIPYDVIWLDIEHTDGKRYLTWDKIHFPDPVSMQNKIAAHGRKMVTIVDPHIKRDSSYFLFSKATSLGYFIKNSDGKDYDGWCWPGSSSYLDFTDPEVREWWGKQLSLNNYKGSTNSLYVWNDMNEPSVFNGPEVSMQKDCLNRLGVEHREWHNLYGMYMQRATAEGLQNRGLEKNGGKPSRPFVLSRSFAPGSQRWGAVWTGDNVASWEHLKISLPMLLSLSISGLPFVGADVGGFFGNPTPELFTRWIQAAAYQPFFRSHAHHDSKRREPWVFGEPWTSRIRAAIMDRYTLLPYWYTLFAYSHKTGVPPMCPLWFHYPADQSTFAMDNQFMVGTDLLIVPVTAPNTETVEVYLPGHSEHQIWYTLDRYERLHSTSTFITVDAPIDRIPVFQRGGSIIPRQMRLRRSSALMKDDPYTLVIALNDVGFAEGILYLDDGASFDYEKNDGYLKMRFKMEYGMITGRPIEGMYVCENTIERIIVMGLQQMPSSVSSVSRSIDFLWEDRTSILIIRKPELRVASEFDVELLFESMKS